MLTLFVSRYSKPVLPVSIRCFIAMLFLCCCQWAKAQVPVVSGFTPASGLEGAAVTITGSGFSTVAGNNIVYFGATKATVNTATTGSLGVTVPAGASFSRISVTVNGFTANSAQAFLPTFTGAVPGFTQSAFSFPVSYETGGSTAFPALPGEVAVADIDGDGKADIIALNDNDSSAGILLNRSSSGTLSFAPYVEANLPSFGNDVMALADMNGDGKIDITAVSARGGKLSVTLNHSTPGTVSFGSRVDLNTDSVCFGVSVSDIDGDGRPDIVIAENYLNKISVFRNTGSAGNLSFAAPVDFPALPGVFNVTTGDLDNDGKADIGTANTNSASISIYKNNSTPGNIVLAARLDLAAAGGCIDLVFGDLDRDGKPDIAASNYWDNSISIFKNTGSGTMSFAAANSFSNFDDPETIALADFDGDGKPEIVTSGFNANIAVFKNTSVPGTVSFYPYSTTYYGGGGPGIAANDLDGDGRPDIIAGNYSGSSIKVLRNRINEPDVHFFEPNTGGAGTVVTITGTSFSGVSSVLIGGVPADSFRVLNADTIIAVVPNAAFGDSIKVISPVGTGAGGYFYYTGPYIFSFSPQYAVAGDTVLITGNNFNGADTVKFGNTTARSFSLIDNEHIIAVVDSGASGKVYVGSPAGFHEAAGFTYYVSPAIISFSPVSASGGQTVTIKGRHFTGIDSVQFGGMNAASFMVTNDSTITAVTGSGASGNVLVKGIGGTAIKAGFIFNGPVIRSFSPATGKTGDTIIIKGSGLLNTTQVSFGGAAAGSFTVSGDSTVKAVLANGATGAIAVTTATGTSIINGFVFLAMQVVPLCPSSDYLYISSDVMGTVYQWQVDTGNGFTNLLDDNVNVYGSNTVSLYVNEISSSQTGHVYRCIVDTGYSGLFQVRFTDEWLGYTADWNDPNNWGCGDLPDANTDVTIRFGQVVLNANTTVRSLTLWPGVNFVVSPGVTLTITH